MSFALLWSSLSSITMKFWLGICESWESELCSLYVMSPCWDIEVFVWTLYLSIDCGRLGVLLPNHLFPKSLLSLIHQQSKRNYPLNQSYSYLHWIHFCLRLTHHAFYPPLQTNHDGLLQNIHHNHLIEWYLFSPWSNGEIAYLVLKSNHSPIHW